MKLKKRAKTVMVKLTLNNFETREATGNVDEDLAGRKNQAMHPIQGVIAHYTLGLFH